MIKMDGSTPRTQIRRLASFGLTTPDAHRLSEFYQYALGFRVLETVRRWGPDFERLTGVTGGASAISLCLGDDVVELLQFDRPGRSYPSRADSSDLCFQHFAIVVADIQLAYQKLVSAGGWTAISTDGPQQLPAASGGVTAFKFRDPDGHPLELLSFRRNHMPSKWRDALGDMLYLGVDHSAISVSDTAASIGFYTALGLSVSSNSRNAGPEQDALDGLAHVMVDVTGLVPPSPAPHVELLCYRREVSARPEVLCANDIAATQLVFEGAGTAAPFGLTDPDGHHLLIFPNSDPPRAA